MKKIKNGSQGFTLLELLVVVLIIGILAGIALPQYQMAVAKSKFSTLKSRVKAMYEAELRYYMTNGKYSDKLSGLDIDPGNNCYIDNLGGNTYTYVACYTTIKKKDVTLYIMIKSNRKTCMTKETDINGITHRLCKEESKKKTYDHHSNGNWQYHWY